MTELHILLWLMITFGASYATPQVATIVLLFAFSSIAISTREYLHPAFLIGIALCSYLLIGGTNFTIYRGTITDETFGAIFRNIAFLCAGAFCATSGSTFDRSMRISRSPAYGGKVELRRMHILISAIPGLIGVIWIVGTVGIPLLRPEARFMAPAKAVLLCELLTVPFALQVCRILSLQRVSAADFAILTAIAVILAVPGYRGLPLIAMLVSIIAGGMSGRVRLSLFRTALILILALSLLSFGQILRRSLSSELSSNQTIISRYYAETLPLGFAQLHFSLRESIALTQRILLTPRFGGTQVLFADIASMRPGSDMSGGQMVAQAMGASEAGGLTPGATSLIYLAAGPYGAIVFILVGAGIGRLWRRYRAMASTSTAVLYAFAIVYTIHWFHRGVIKPGYILIPFAFYMAIKLIENPHWNWLRAPVPVLRAGPGSRRGRLDSP
jgi:hypothetical protein